MRFQIAWPDTPGNGRYIPPTANRIVVSVSGADFTPPKVAVINRQPISPPAEVTLEDIPAGLHRWISAEAREVDPSLLGEATIINPTPQQMTAGRALAAGRMIAPVPIFDGVRLNADIELLPPATPGPGVGSISVAIQQVIPDSFPMVLLIDSIQDQNGNPVTELNPANFRLYETGPSGVEQEAPIIDVRTANEAATPSNVALVLDRSGSMSGSPMSSLRSACRTFLDQLQPGDAAELISFASTVSVNQFFTQDVQLLRSALDNLSPAGTTAFFDAMGLGIRHASARGGRAAVVGMTDGGDNASSQYSRSSLSALAVASAIPLYTVGLRGDDFQPSVLQALARDTNGLYYETPTASQLETIYRSIAGQLAAQVQVTFLSPAPDPSPVTRRLRLEYEYGPIHGESRSQYVFNGASGSVQPINISGTGSITSTDPQTSSNHHYDDLSFTTTRDGYVVVRMWKTGTSGSVEDPYVQILRNGSLVISNDDGGGNLDAEAWLTASAGTNYVARFLTFDPADRGSYNYSITETDTRQPPSHDARSEKPASATR